MNAIQSDQSRPPKSSLANQYRFLLRQWILLVAISIQWPIVQAVASESTDDGPPNIIFLLADDQTFDSLGCYGNTTVKTPTIDKLAASGLAFDRYYNTTAICMGSRANIMTGLYEFRTGCNFSLGDLPLKHFENSYPVRLRKAGYLTAIAGKIGFVVEGKGLPKDDFDWWGGSPGQTSYNTAENESIAKYAKEYPHSTLAYGAFGSDFVKWAADKDKPFCLSISFKAPHRPDTPDPRFNDVYKDTVFPKAENFGRENGLHFSEQSRRGRQYPRFVTWGYRDRYNKTVKKYHQQVYAIDQALKMIQTAIAEAGVSKNTVIIYTSDNGFFNGAHGYGSKVLPYEESARAPMIIYDPRQKFKTGKRTSAITGNIDVAPTILQLAGLEVPENIDGKSLLPLMKNPEMQLRQHMAIFNFWGAKETFSMAVIKEQMKYIYWYFDSDEMDPAEELYDLSADPLELQNVASEQSQRQCLDDMRAAYDQYIKQIDSESERAVYKKYSVLFDRHLEWSKKKAALKHPKKKSKDKASVR